MNMPSNVVGSKRHALHQRRAFRRSHSSGLQSRGFRGLSVPVRAQQDGGREDKKQDMDVDKMNRMSKGQMLFYRIKQKAEEKFQSIMERKRVKWQQSEDQYFQVPQRPLVHDGSVVYPQDANLGLSGLIVGLKNAIKYVLLQVFYLPITLALQAVVKVSTWWRSKFGPEQFEYFLLAEGEKIWGWRNRTENERWFWSFFMFRVLLPTVGGIYIYEAFVPNNILWAVALPYWFYWQFQKMWLSPWTLDWWLVMYFGFYCKCWPDVLCWLRYLFFWG